MLLFLFASHFFFFFFLLSFEITYVVPKCNVREIMCVKLPACNWKQHKYFQLGEGWVQHTWSCRCRHNSYVTFQASLSSYSRPACTHFHEIFTFSGLPSTSLFSHPTPSVYCYMTSAVFSQPCSGHPRGRQGLSDSRAMGSSMSESQSTTNCFSPSADSRIQGSELHSEMVSKEVWWRAVSSKRHLWIKMLPLHWWLLSTDLFPFWGGSAADFLMITYYP